VNIAYETTPADVVDGLAHQHLKYGRDVLRTKSGTCVNTSIFYASVAEAAGLEAYIYVIPGHAFAAVRLPKSGQMLYVETTGCGGGTWESSLDFVRACKVAGRTFEGSARDGLILEVDIKQLRRQGVTPPELPDAGPNPLRGWQIVTPRPPEKPPATEKRDPAPIAALSPIAGVWDAIRDGKERQVWVFHGNGTYKAGATLDKPFLEGRYAYADGALTLELGQEGKETVAVTWSEDRNRFGFQSGKVAFTFQRRPVAAQILEVRQEHNVEQEGRKGLAIHVHLRVDNAPGQRCEAIAVFCNRAGQLIKTDQQAYRSSDGYLCIQGGLNPNFANTEWKDLVFFLPYEALSASTTETQFRFGVNVRRKGDERFLLDKPAQGEFSLKKP
jgi:hypothetical protein